MRSTSSRRKGTTQANRAIQWMLFVAIGFVAFGMYTSFQIITETSYRNTYETVSASVAPVVTGVSGGGYPIAPDSRIVEAKDGAAPTTHTPPQRFGLAQKTSRSTFEGDDLLLLYTHRTNATTVDPFTVPEYGVIKRIPFELDVYNTFYFPSDLDAISEVGWAGFTVAAESFRTSSSRSYVGMRKYAVSPYFREFWVGKFVCFIVGGHGSVLVQHNGRGRGVRTEVMYLPRHSPTAPNISGVYMYESTEKFEAELGNTLRLHGQLMNAGQWMSHKYFHFLLEGLPKILTMLPFVNGDQPLYINIAGNETFLQDTLQLLKIHATVVDCNYTRPCNADTLLTTNVVRTCPTPFLSLMVRSALLKAVWGARYGDDPPGWTRTNISSDNLVDGKDVKILVLDRPSSERRLWNCVEIIQALKHRWPAAKIELFLDPPSMERMIRLFASAHIGIGPHGAGNQNSLFLHTDTPFIPIESRARPKWFNGYAAAAGMRVWPYGKAVGMYNLTNVTHFVERVELALEQRYG